MDCRGLPGMTSSRTPSSSENVFSPLLPGGNLISASLDRQIMVWSDRGGASRHIGDRWAVRSAEALTAAIGHEWPIPHASPYTLTRVIRLDDVPEVSREANRHHLENPDFVLLGRRSGGGAIIQAADAKFAADRIKPSQVSADVVSNLLAVENGVTRALVDETVRQEGLSDPLIVRGVFVVPRSELTEHLLKRVTTGRNPTVDRLEVVSVDPEPGAMFAGLPPARLIGSLARIDALPVTPRANLISAIYYFRLACACYFLWSETEKPLLSTLPASEPEPGLVAAEVSTRSAKAGSAYELVATWAVDVEPQVSAREAISAVASLPIRMRDLRARVERAGAGADGKVVRNVRRDLDIAFRTRLVEAIGEIPANDPRPLTLILNDVATASRALTGEMQALMDELIVRYSNTQETPADMSQ
jgi:hypothetical protein